MFWVKHFPEGTVTLPFSLVSHSPKPPRDAGGAAIAGLGVVIDSEHRKGVPAIMRVLRTASARITQDLTADHRFAG